MHSSAFVALAIAAAAGPAFAAPAPVVARQAVTVSSAPASGGLEVDTGLIKDVVDIGNGIIQGADGIKQLFTRQATTGQSGAIDTELIKNIVEIGGDIIQGADGIKDLFTSSGSSSSSKREEILMLARQAAAGNQSAALNLGSLFGDLVNGITSLFGGGSTSTSTSSQQQSSKRELVELLARQVQVAHLANGQSGALNLGSIFSDIVSGISDLFGGGSSSQQQSSKREIAELLARAQAGDQSAALNLGSIFSDIVSGISDLFGGGSSSSSTQQQSSKRELTEHFARQLQVAQSGNGQAGAISIGDIFSDIVNGIGSLFRRDFSETSKRELVELLARQTQMDPATAMSAAISLGSLANIAKIGSDVIGGFEDLFGGDSSDNSQQSSKREFLEHFARQAAATSTSSAAPSSTATPMPKYIMTSSGAINVGDILSTAASFLPLLFKRDGDELMAREPFVVLPGQTPPQLPSFSGSNFHPLFLRNAARSLNELD